MANLSRTQSIKNFLTAKTHIDLADLYNHDMECQVNVAQDGGTRVDQEYKGHSWQAWTDGIQTWKPLRIPYNAMGTPEFEDVPMSYDLAKHAEGIGMTGWNWKERRSKWVAFDFDAISGHSDRHTKNLTSDELAKLRETVLSVPWVTLRKSTSGKGLHLYVFVEDVPTDNHTEHAALARAILGKLSALTGYDFENRVDVCGGNMWVWHRKMAGTDGLTLIKRGEALSQIPINWRDHITVVKGKRRKVSPVYIQDINDSNEETPEDRLFDDMTSQRPKVALDETHKALLKYLLEDNPLGSWWDSDHHMLVTHTVQLQKAHEELNLRGIFKTISEGTDLTTQNAFCFPLRNGAWSVRRYGMGVQEADTWTQDVQGYTRCYYNHDPDLRTAARSFGGLESPKGGFVFREFEIAEQVVASLGGSLGDTKEMKVWAAKREAVLKPHKDGRLVVEVERKEMDQLRGWLPVKDTWVKIVDVKVENPVEQETANFDDLVRHIVGPDADDQGWVINDGSGWREEPLIHVQKFLKTQGVDTKAIEIILGQAIHRAWRLVNKPFQPEYPGDRQWNRNAAQFRMIPSLHRDLLHYPNWLKILKHCGQGLDQAVAESGWCQANAILTGADYLKVWIASAFQRPLEPTPYLFLFGPENSGKSILHEALSLLITKGYKRADAALVSQGGFNAELEGAIICVVEETNLNEKGRGRDANNRIKDWVTARELAIHPKGKTPYHVANSTHWIQCANDIDYCPVFPGDTRITMTHVNSIDPVDMIPKRTLIDALEREAPDFLAAIINLELPPVEGRLSVPVIVTEDKTESQRSNRSAVEVFVEENVWYVPGAKTKYTDAWMAFQDFLEPGQLSQWTKHRFSRDFPDQFPIGRFTGDGQHYIGNLVIRNGQPEAPAPQGVRYVMKKQGDFKYIVPEDKDNHDHPRGS